MKASFKVVQTSRSSWIFRKISEVVLLLGLPVSTVLADSNTGTVGNIFIHSDNTTVLFRLKDVTLDGCATSNRYSIDISTQQGKGIYSAVLSAKAANQTIKVVGLDNVCNIRNDSEDIEYVMVE